MRNLNSFLAAALAFALVALPAFSVTRAHSLPLLAQQSGTLERGYRTGYSDGYQEGIRDSSEPGATRAVINDDEIQSERGYNPTYGSVEAYRGGYVQGFRAGYDTGFARQPFDSNPPADLSSRPTVDNSTVGNGTIDNGTADNTTPNDNTADDPFGNPDDINNGNSGGVANTGGSARVITTGRTVRIPIDTIMRVELLTNLSTEASQMGDRFQARVLEPAEYEGAMIDGRVTRIKRPGKLKGRSEIQLSFDQIRLTDNRWANLEALVIEVVDTAGSGVGEVDEEGGVKGKSGTKDDIVKVGAGTGIGAAIGAILGGGKGAAIGAVIGGAVGTGGALSSRGSEIYLPHGQQ
ncbi:MAG: hypothetical protein WCF57_22250, partial [Pyrinomonadaceae bacterium]